MMAVFILLQEDRSKILQSLSSITKVRDELSMGPVYVALLYL